MASWIPIPGRNANWAASMIFFLTISLPKRWATTWLISLPTIGLTDIGLTASRDVTMPPSLGVVVIVVVFCASGMFLVLKLSVMMCASKSTALVSGMVFRLYRSGSCTTSGGIISHLRPM